MFRWIEHTVELEIESATEEAVFVDPLAAVAELLEEGKRGRLALA